MLGWEEGVLGDTQDWQGEAGESAGVFSSEGARCLPSPGHLRGRGLGAWRDPLKYVSIFPQLSSKGTPS